MAIFGRNEQSAIRSPPPPPPPPLPAPHPHPPPPPPPPPFTPSLCVDTLVLFALLLSLFRPSHGTSFRLSTLHTNSTAILFTFPPHASPCHVCLYACVHACMYVSIYLPPPSKKIFHQSSDPKLSPLIHPLETRLSFETPPPPPPPPSPPSPVTPLQRFSYLPPLHIGSSHNHKLLDHFSANVVSNSFPIPLGKTVIIDTSRPRNAAKEWVLQASYYWVRVLLLGESRPWLLGSVARHCRRAKRPRPWLQLLMAWHHHRAKGPRLG